MQKKVTATVKKASAKKAVKSVKKVATKTKKAEAKKTLVYATNANSFWVNNGQILNSLIALKEAIASMENEVFSHHVNKDKNDFADWVENVLCDSACANDLRKAKTVASVKTVVTKHLKSYQI